MCNNKKKKKENYNCAIYSVLQIMSWSDITMNWCLSQSWRATQKLPVDACVKGIVAPVPEDTYWILVLFFDWIHKTD